MEERPRSTNQPASDEQVEKLADAEYRALADFRFQIRRFVHFSETAAHAEGLEPQQHQFLLAVRAFDKADGPLIGDVASALLIRHHSAVGLADRLAERRLIKRVRRDVDGRQVRIKLTPSGERKLARLSSAHRAELMNTGPILVKSLGALLRGLRRNIN